MPRRREVRNKPNSLARQIADAKKRVAPLLADMDPSDLDLTISSLLRPFGSGRRFFLRQIKPGVYVF